jgi:superfamily I DNA and/or RNA helicase
VIRNLLDKAVEAAAKLGMELRCVQKVGGTAESDATEAIAETDENARVFEMLASGEAQVAAGTAWLWAREEAAGSVDVLFVDEAGQISLANAIAVSQAARSVVLLGDPQQLEQPKRGSHPDGTDVSALEHLLGKHQTMPPDRGLFLATTWRLHPAICAFTSELFYESRLRSREGLERQEVLGETAFAGAGLWFVPVEHEGNPNASTEEADIVASLVAGLLDGSATWRNEKGVVRPVELDDILIVAPYNAHVAALLERLPAGARAGTVDKFQGQEAPIVIYSLATSSPELAPRGMEFLYSPSRLNVATSRARSTCILVANPRLFEPECRTPQQMKLANALCRYLEMAKLPGS